MYKNVKAAIIPRNGSKFLTGYVVQFNNDVLIAECRVSNDVLPKQKAQVFLYDTSRGEIEYEGEIESIANNTVVLNNLVFVKKTQRREEIRVNLDLILKAKEIIMDDGRVVKLKEELEMQTINLSAGGISFICKMNIKRRTKIPVELQINNEAVLCIAEIIRKEEMNNGYYSYGCKFTDLTGHMQDKIRGYIYKQQVKNRKY